MRGGAAEGGVAEDGAAAAESSAASDWLVVAMTPGSVAERDKSRASSSLRRGTATPPVSAVFSLSSARYMMERLEG